MSALTAIAVARRASRSDLRSEAETVGGILETVVLTPVLTVVGAALLLAWATVMVVGYAVTAPAALLRRALALP